MWGRGGPEEVNFLLGNDIACVINEVGLHKPMTQSVITRAQAAAAQKQVLDDDRSVEGRSTA